MGNQVIGLMLLIAAISVALYIGTNYDQISGIGISSFPSLRAIDYVPSVSLPEYDGRTDDPVIESSPVPIAVSNIRPQTSDGYGELVLSADWNIPASGVDIAGWRIGSLENEFAITGAQEIYTFGGSVKRLVIRPGDEVRMFSGYSPRGNFRINKCIGYLSELGNFNPPLERRCPNPSYEDTNYLSNACRGYLSSLSSCETPRASSVSFNDRSCQEYLNTVNYESCVSRHQSDSDFLSREIWVWVGDNLKYFDQRGDIVRIYDNAGRLVSQYRY